MGDEAALLNAIYANPDEDTPRLVYADWLDEHDQPERAEFIRAQIRLNEIRQTIPHPDEGALLLHYGLSRASGVWHCPGDSSERRELAYRCRCLLDTHEASWLTPLQDLLHNEWFWSRGFLEVAAVKADKLSTSAKMLFGQHPIQRLVLTGPGNLIGTLATIPDDSSLSSLDLILSDLDLEALTKLARFQNLARLTELNLAFCGLRDSVVDFLCEEPFFQRLTLNLCCNPFTDDARQRLRDHLGSRVSFERVRHQNRLFSIASHDSGLTGPEYYGTGSIHAGLGRDQAQVLLEVLANSDTVYVFDHSGDLLSIETRTFWGEEEQQQRTKQRNAWLSSLGYRPAAIHVKRFPSVYDYPKSWADQFDMSDTEPQDYATGAEFMTRWLSEDSFRFGSFCGGWWMNRKSGKQAEH